MGVSVRPRFSAHQGREKIIWKNEEDSRYWQDKVRYRFTMLTPELYSSSHMSKDRTTSESLYFHRKTNLINRYHCRRDKWVYPFSLCWLKVCTFSMSKQIWAKKVIKITFSTSTHHLEYSLFARNVTYHVFQLYSPPTENMTLKDDGLGHNQTRQKKPRIRGEWRSFALTFCFFSSNCRE